MSKYKNAKVRYEDEEDYINDKREKRKKEERRQWKRMKNELRTRNFTIEDDDSNQE